MPVIDFQKPFAIGGSSGLDRGVVYHADEFEPWIGLYSLEYESDAETETVVYVDGVGQRAQLVLTGFQATVQCYLFPELIDNHTFDFTYRTFDAYGRTLIHLVYGCRATLSSMSNVSLETTTNAQAFTVGLSAVPRKLNHHGFRPASHLIIHESLIWPEALKAIEDVLYGTTTTDPRMPSIDEVIEILEKYVSLRVTAHGDGTWTAEEINTTGIIKMVDITEFSITWDSALYIDNQVYTIQSL